MQRADRLSDGGHVLIAELLSFFVWKFERHELRLRGPREGRTWWNDLPHPAPVFNVPLVPEVPAKVVERIPEIARGNIRLQVKQRMQDDHGRPPTQDTPRANFHRSSASEARGHSPYSAKPSGNAINCSSQRLPDFPEQRCMRAGVDQFGPRLH